MMNITNWIWAYFVWKVTRFIHRNAHICGNIEKRLVFRYFNVCNSIFAWELDLFELQIQIVKNGDLDFLLAHYFLFWI